MRFFIGIIGIPIGFLMVIYRERIKRFTGDIAWAEKHFGPGGSYTAILIFGLAIAMGSFLYMLGTLQLLFEKLFRPFFPQ